MVPRWIVGRFIIDADLRAVVTPLRREGRGRPRRNAYVLAHQVNHIRKYRAYCPKSVPAAQRASIEGMPYANR
jgi:hypothetical protein